MAEQLELFPIPKTTRFAPAVMVDEERVELQGWMFTLTCAMCEIEWAVD